MRHMIMRPSSKWDSHLRGNFGLSHSAVGLLLVKRVAGCDIALSEYLLVADPPTDQTHPDSEYDSGPKLQAHPLLTSADVTFGGPD